MDQLGQRRDGNGRSTRCSQTWWYWPPKVIASRRPCSILELIAALHDAPVRTGRDRGSGYVAPMSAHSNE
ncbi:hypothetical protein [Occultella kanbiaonis]|uniref:hypothetical protein n=1 Tax=Occultella kanbiaonis TaxID=2675754 RepID=UPI0013D5C044|nr:hypothetical protein [Occultella kanbiaonis]